MYSSERKINSDGYKREAKYSEISGTKDSSGLMLMSHVLCLYCMKSWNDTVESSKLWEETNTLKGPFDELH